MEPETSSHRPAPLRRHLVTALSILIALASLATVALHLANRADPGSPLDPWWLTNVLAAIGLGSVGTLIARRLPTNPIGWLFLAAAVAQGVIGAARGWVVFVEVGGHDLPGVQLAGSLGSWPFVVLLATLPAILLLFPNGHLPSARWRWVMRALGLCGVLGLVQVITAPGPYDEAIPELVNPIGIESVALDLMGLVAQVGFLVIMVLSVTSLFVRLRRADAQTRQQLRWVAAGATVLVLEVMVEFVPGDLPDESLLAWTGPFALALFVATIAVAVLRYRLWDLDLFIKMSVVYVVLTGLVATIYVGLVATAGSLSDDHVEIGPSLLAAAVAVGVFALARDRVQHLVERLFFGDRGDPYRALSHLGRRLDQPGSPDAVLDEVVDAIAQSLCLGHVAIAVSGAGPVAAVGTPCSATRDIPLLFRNETVGRLQVCARAGSHIRRRDLEVLADLARPVAAVLHAVAVGEELQRSRQELVTAREEERRRVRRDLHDGLGPALAAVRMKLDGVGLMIDPDPDSAKSLVGQLTCDIRETIASIRRLVYDLQPPVLDEMGFVSAVAAQTRAFSGPLEGGGTLDVSLEAPAAIEGLSAAVEVAAYRIVCEGLANVARHAHAARCHVRVDLNGGLEVAIDDDGVGLGGDVVAGVGTTSMVQRAEELGGTCRIGSSTLGGTQVLAHLPTAPGLARVTDELGGGVP